MTDLRKYTKRELIDMVKEKTLERDEWKAMALNAARLLNRSSGLIEAAADALKQKEWGSR